MKRELSGRAKTARRALFNGAAILAIAGGAVSAPVYAADEEKFSDKIVVTATRREESLQKVPESITAISSLEIEQASLKGFEDFAARVPNLSFGYANDGRLGARGVAIRGISGDGTTAFFIDETPISESMSPLVLDVERIEVLRGPQGTLFGSQSMGGAIRFISKKPNLEEVEGYGFGSGSWVQEGDADYAFNGAVSAPIVKGEAALRLSAYYDRESGVFDREYPDPANPAVTLTNENVDSQRTYGGQASLLWRPTDNLEILPRFWFQRLESDGARFADIDPDNFTQVRDGNVEEPASDRWYNANVTATYHTPIGQLLSSTSYFDRQIHEAEDMTDFVNGLFGRIFGTEPGILTDIRQAQHSENFTQELRFASEFEAPVQVVVGGFYTKEKLDDTLDGNVPGLDASEGGAVGTDNLAGIDVHREIEEKAVFGDVTVNFTDQLSVTGGVRWFDIDITLDRENSGFFFGGYSAVSEDASDSGVNPKAQVNYQMNDDVLVYAGASKGYRRGGSNSPVPLICEADLADLGLGADDVLGYSSDRVWNYEVGAKTQMADGRVTVNGALYRIDWSDIIQEVRLGCGATFTGNAGKARSQGFELEIEAQPTDSLFARVGVGFTDATITEGGATVALQPGDRVYQVPRWNVGGTLNYEYTFPTGAPAYLRGDVTYVSQSYSANNDATTPRVRPGYTLVDLKAGVFFGEWEAALVAKNVTNEHVNYADNISIAAEVRGRPRIVTNRPRRIGVELRRSF